MRSLAIIAFSAFILFACDKKLIQSKKDFKELEGSWVSTEISPLSAAEPFDSTQVPDVVYIDFEKCKLSKKNRVCRAQFVLNDGNPITASLNTSTTSGIAPDKTTFTIKEASGKNDFIRLNASFLLEELSENKLILGYYSNSANTSSFRIKMIRQ